jgi:hypothetical protein
MANYECETTTRGLTSMDSPEEVLGAVREAMVAGDLATAEVVLRQASKRWSREPEFAVRHAKVLSQQGNEKAAFKVYRKVMKKAPERLDACRGAADCAIKIGKGRDAEKLYGRAIGLGMSLDVASAGISRSFTIRNRYAEAWDKALTQFKDSGRKSRELYALLKEISPIVGAAVPPLNEFDMADVEQTQEEVRRDHSDPVLTEKSFIAGSLEAMAGVDKETLVDDDNLDLETLLGGSTQGAGPTSLGIDLSFLDEPGQTGDGGEDAVDTQMAETSQSDALSADLDLSEPDEFGFLNDPASQETTAGTSTPPTADDSQPDEGETQSQPSVAGSQSAADDDDPFADFPDL